MSNIIESINKIKIYEKNGQKINTVKDKRPSITIKEHWNIRDFIVIKIGEISYTVSARDLKKAIENAQNAHDLI